MVRLVMVIREPLSRDLSWFNHRITKGPSWVVLGKTLGLNLSDYHSYTTRRLQLWAACERAQASETRNKKSAPSIKGGGVKLFVACYNYHGALDHLSLGLYAPQIKLWAAKFSRDHITILQYEEMQRGPNGFLSALSSALAMPFRTIHHKENPIKGTNRQLDRQDSAVKVRLAECRTKSFLEAFFQPWNEALFAMEPELKPWLQTIPCQE